MAPFFRKASPSAALQADAEKLRVRRNDLAKHLGDASAAVLDRQTNVERLLIDDADAAALSKAQSALSDTERTIRSLTGAIARLDEEISAKDREVAAIADKRQREQTSGEAELVRSDIGPAGAAAINSLINLAEVARRAGGVVNDGTGLHLVAERFAADLPAALELIESSLRSHIAAVLNGSAPAVHARPDVAPAPVVPKQPTKRVFSMAPLFWREGNLDGTCARHQDIEMPVEFANRALTLGYAIEPTDEQTRGRRTGFVAPPLPAYCVDLADENLKPLKPVFGLDRVKRDARFAETVGSDRRSWINAERAQ
jgi:hypothetical protein